MLFGAITKFLLKPAFGIAAEATYFLVLPPLSSGRTKRVPTRDFSNCGHAFFADTITLNRVVSGVRTL